VLDAEQEILEVTSAGPNYPPTLSAKLISIFDAERRCETKKVGKAEALFLGSKLRAPQSLRAAVPKTKNP